MTATIRQSARWAGAPVRLGLIAMIRLYRLTLGGVLGGQCRFHPSCSHYAEEAIRNVGAVRGVGLAAWRIVRCSPLSQGGVDRPPIRRPFLAYDSHIQSGSAPIHRRGVGG